MINTQDKMVSLDKVLEIVEERLAIANQRCIFLKDKYGVKSLASKPNAEYKTASERLNEIMAIWWSLKHDLLRDGGN